MPSQFVQHAPRAIAESGNRLPKFASIKLPTSSTTAIGGGFTPAAHLGTAIHSRVITLASDTIEPFPTSSTTAVGRSFTPASNSTASVEISLVTNTITTLPTSSTTTIDTSKSGELSSGAKVGITVGSTVIGLSLFAGILFLVLRSKRREQDTRNDIDRREEEKGGDRVYQKAELSNDHMRYELPEILLQELPGERQVHELAGDLNAFELDADMMRSRTELGAATPVPSGSEG